MENDIFLTAREIGPRLRISLPTVYRMAREGEIPAKRVGGSWRFPRVEFEAWLVERVQNGHKKGSNGQE